MDNNRLLSKGEVPQDIVLNWNYQDKLIISERNVPRLVTIQGQLLVARFLS